MAKNKNPLGQYMTPSLITNFMVELISHEPKCSVLEPSCGDGAFLDSLTQHNFCNITAYEIDPKIINPKYSVINQSFISAQDIGYFDVIIGNPPYIKWKNLEDFQKEELKQSRLWTTYFNSLCDYSNIFILKAIEHLKDNGELIFITPEYWLTTTHASKLRNYMMERGYLEIIYHLNETPIFKDAALSLVIFKYVKSKKISPKIEVIKCSSNKKLKAEDLIKIKHKDLSLVESFTIDQFKQDDKWILTPLEVKQNIIKYEQSCTLSASKQQSIDHPTSYLTIGDLFEIGNGMVSGLDKGFQIPEELKLTPLEQQATIEVLKAKNLKGYVYSGKVKYMLLREQISEELLRTDYPNFYALLEPYKSKLLGRYDYGKKINYWEWAFLRNYNLFSRQCAKIFVPSKDRINQRKKFRFTYASPHFYPTQDVTAIYPKHQVKEDLLYVLALLNSEYVFQWLTNNGVKKGDVIEFSEKPISSIPYRSIDFNQEDECQIYQQIVKLMQSYMLNQAEQNLTKIAQLFTQLIK